MEGFFFQIVGPILQFLDSILESFSGHPTEAIFAGTATMLGVFAIAHFKTR